MHISEDLYARLVKQLDNAEFGKSYQQLRHASTELSAHASPRDLLDTLGEGNSSYEERDSCLWALISAARRRDHLSTPALTILLLTMWPSLLLVVERLRYLILQVGDPLSEVYWSFIEELDHPTYNRRWKIAANLARNTSKRVMKKLRVEWGYNALLADIEEWARQTAEDSAEMSRRLSSEQAEVSEEETQELRQLIEKHVATGAISFCDAALLVGHSIYGVPLKQLAEQEGIDYAALRQRLCRARAKLKSVLETELG